MQRQIAQWTFEILQNIYYYRYVLFICHCHHCFCMHFLNFPFPFILLLRNSKMNIKTDLWKPILYRLAAMGLPQMYLQLAKCYAA